MTETRDLTKGEISPILFKLAIPLMGTSLLQMSYQITDMFWLGKVGTQAVAAVGIVGQYLWLISSLIILCQVGLSVGVSQSFGKSDLENTKNYICGGFRLGFLIAMTITAIFIIFHNELIGLYSFKEGDAAVQELASEYMVAIAFGLVFMFLNPLFASTFNSMGNSKTPFIISSIGLLINMVLDPVFIFVFHMGAMGTAIASVIATLVIFLIYIYIGFKNDLIYVRVNYLKKVPSEITMHILKLGVPMTLMEACHASVSMVLTGYLTKLGAYAVSAMSIGSQIESISWMTANGFSVANTAFTGQNYGKGTYDRIVLGFKKSMRIMATIGTATSLLLIVFAQPIFAAFLPDDPVAMQAGANYLRILGYSQLFMVIEIGVTGFFNGIGRTKEPSYSGVVLNLMRIPFAMIFMKYYGLNGVWIAISLSSILKGVVAYVWFKIILKKEIEPKVIA